VVARRDGTRAKFAVRRVERYPKAHSPTARVHGPTRRAALRLITCGSAFYGATGHYVDQRRRLRRADSELASLD
jgi:hypothetical protein